MERDLNSNSTALEKADKSFDEAGDVAKVFSNSVKKAADTDKDAYGKLSKLIDTAKKIGAALGAAAAAVGTACVATTKKAPPKQCINVPSLPNRLTAYAEICPQNKPSNFASCVTPMAPPCPA